jgi:hypothetical protein
MVHLPLLPAVGYRLFDFGVEPTRTGPKLGHR